MKDITQTVIHGTTIGRDLTNLEARVKSYPGVKDCRLEVTSVNGRKIDPATGEIVLEGSVAVETNLLLQATLRVGGTGALDLASGALTITDVQIRNDFQGMLKKIAEWLGFAPGRVLVLNRAAVEQIGAALAEPV